MGKSPVAAKRPPESSSESESEEESAAPKAAVATATTTVAPPAPAVSTPKRVVDKKPAEPLEIDASELELQKQMAALGLPVSFTASVNQGGDESDDDDDEDEEDDA